nr:TPA_asm: hypothetical protein [Phamor tricladivirus]
MDRTRRRDLESALESMNPGSGRLLNSSWTRLDEAARSLGRLGGSQDRVNPSASSMTAGGSTGPGSGLNQYPYQISPLVPHLPQQMHFGRPAWRETSMTTKSFQPQGHVGQDFRAEQSIDPSSQQYDPTSLTGYYPTPTHQLSSMQPEPLPYVPSPSYNPVSPEYQGPKELPAPSYDEIEQYRRYQAIMRDFEEQRDRRLGSRQQLMQSVPVIEEILDNPAPAQSLMQQSIMPQSSSMLSLTQSAAENQMEMETSMARESGTLSLERKDVTPNTAERVDRDGNALVPMSRNNTDYRRSGARSTRVSIGDDPLSAGPVTKRRALNAISAIETPTAMEASQSLNNGTGIQRMIDESVHRSMFPSVPDVDMDAPDNLMVIRPPQTIDNQGSHPIAGKDMNALKKRANLIKSRHAQEEARQRARDQVRMRTGEWAIPILGHEGAKVRAIGAKTFIERPETIPRRALSQERLFAGSTDLPAIGWHDEYHPIQERRNVRKKADFLFEPTGMLNYRNWMLSKTTGDAPDVVTDSVVPQKLDVNLVHSEKKPSILQSLMGGVARELPGLGVSLLQGLGRWGSSGSRRGPIYSAGNQRSLLKMVGDAPTILSTGDGLAKLVGDAPGQPDVDFGGGDVSGGIAMDSEAGHAQDELVSAIRLQHYFGPTFAEMIVCEQRVKSSYAGEARAKDDLLRNIILQSTSLQWAFNTNDLTTSTVIPGLSMYPNYCIYPYDATGKFGRYRTPPCHWRIDEEAGENCVPLMSTFSVDNLVGAVRSGGNMTAFTSVLRLNTSFFSADELSRFFSLTIGTINNRVGYGFESQLIKLVMYGMTYNPVLGDEMAQLFSHFGYIYNINGAKPWTIEGWFPFQREWPDSASTPTQAMVGMRVVDHADFIKHVANNDAAANPWAAGWERAYWWPYNRDEETAVAVVMISTEQLNEGNVNYWTMLSKMAYPAMHITALCDPYVWEQGAGNWANIVPDDFTKDGQKTSATPVPNLIDIPGAYKRVLFVLTDNIWHDQSQLDVASSRLVSKNYVLARWPKNAAANAGVACADAAFNMNNVLAEMGDGDGFVNFGLLNAIRRWEDSFGHSSAKVAALRVAKNFSALWGMPKACIRKYNNGMAAYDAEEVGVLVNISKLEGVTAFWKRNIVPANDWKTHNRAYLLLEDCGGNLSTATFVESDVPPAWESWKDTRPTKCTYTVSSPEPCIEFMVERGWLMINEEFGTDRLSLGLQNNAISIREQGVMWASFVDFLTQASQINYLHKNQFYLRYVDDPGLALNAQLFEMLDKGYWPTLASYFVTGIQFNVPRWILSIPPPPATVAAIRQLYFDRNIDYLKRSYVPYARVDQYTASRYNPNIQYNDASLSLSAGRLDYGVVSHTFRNPAIAEFIDVAAAHIPKNNAYNLMTRKMTMSYYPEGPEVNENMMLWTCRNAWGLQSPFLLTMPTSGLCFSLAYARWNANVLVTSYSSFRSFPIGYQPRSIHPEEGADAVLSFRVRTMRDAFEAMKTNYNILVTPTSITAFLLNDMPPSLEMHKLFRAQPNLADDF